MKKLLKNKGYIDFGNNNENWDEYNSEEDMSIFYLNRFLNKLIIM